MKICKTLSVFVLLSICAANSYADRAPVVHNFHTLSGTGGINYTNSNKTGETALLTYTCNNNAVFGTPALSPSAVVLNFPGKNDYVTTTAVDSLAGISVDYLYETGKLPTIELRLSRDGVHWTDPITPSVLPPTAGHFIFEFVPGRYYVKLSNKNSNKAAITTLTYSFGWCNCFLYFPE